MKIWQRYLFSLLIRVFCFILVSLFTLYVLVDFSIHGSHWIASRKDIAIHYLWLLAKFLPLFFSLSFLLTLLKILLDLNMHREITALQTGGLSKKKLLLPFFTFACALIALCYANSQWIIPLADQEKDLNKTIPPLCSLTLQDGSELVYQFYDGKEMQLRDVFWIRSFEDIWHMKSLNLRNDPPEGIFAQRFVRQNGLLEKAESLTSRLFFDLRLNGDKPLQSLAPIEYRSLSALFQHTLGREGQKNIAHLHYKLALPLTCFLIILALSPFALQYFQGRSPFLFIASALFAYVGWMMFLEAMLILAENQILSADAAIWAPFSILGLTSSLYFFKQV